MRNRSEGGTDKYIVTNKHSNANMLHLCHCWPQKPDYLGVSREDDDAILCFNFKVVIMCLPQTAAPNQTEMCIMGRQCVKAAGVGAGAMDGGKWMIARGTFVILLSSLFFVLYLHTNKHTHEYIRTYLLSNQVIHFC
jgi:hypothetical protein